MWNWQAKSDVQISCYYYSKTFDGFVAKEILGMLKNEVLAQVMLVPCDFLETAKQIH